MTDSRHQSYEKHKQELEDTYPVGTLIVLDTDWASTYVTVVIGHSVMTLPDTVTSGMHVEEVAKVEGPRIHCSTNHPQHQNTTDLNDFDRVIAEAVPPKHIVGMFE